MENLFKFQNVIESYSSEDLTSTWGGFGCGVSERHG